MQPPLATPAPAEKSDGRLLLGATPLGQPGDASARLVRAMATADVIAAEDTRRARTLASALEVTPAGRVLSLFDQNEASRVPMLVDEISAGATVLLISDAGMPLINDPGYRLVTACVQAGLTVSCLPGPSAVTTALGVPADVTVVCVDVPGCEHGAVLATADGGTVIFFSMATSFAAAALGAEGLAADVTMLVGNGYVPGHAALALDLLRTEPGVRGLFEARLAAD